MLPAHAVYRWLRLPPERRLYAANGLATRRGAGVLFCTKHRHVKHGQEKNGFVSENSFSFGVRTNICGKPVW